MSVILIDPFKLAPVDLTSITQVLSATSQATTITAPVGIQAGDLIVLLDMACNTSGAPTAVTPTGFTAVTTSVTTSVIRMCASYKLAAGTEGGTSITGMAAGGSGSVAKVMYVFRGNVPAATVTVGDPGSEATSNDPAAQTVTSGSGVVPLVVFGFYGAVSSGIAAGFLSPRTFTVSGVAAKDGELESFANNTNDTDAWLAYKIYNSSPANVVVDMENEDLQCLMSCYIQMAD